MFVCMKNMYNSWNLKQMVKHKEEMESSILAFEKAALRFYEAPTPNLGQLNKIKKYKNHKKIACFQAEQNRKIALRYDPG